MLTKPKIKDEEIIRCLEEGYGLRVESLSFLPLGADFNTVVYRARANEGVYFIKLRRGDFCGASVSVPGYLKEQGLKAVMAPLLSRSGKFWEVFNEFKLSVYPYIEGRNGVEKPLLDRHWIELGRVIGQLHSTHFPEALTAEVPRDDFSLEACEKVRSHLSLIDTRGFKEPIAIEMASFLKSKAALVLRLIEQVEALKLAIEKQPLKEVLCHGDLHGWNLLIDKQEQLYLLDWDTLIWAPKERDLMFIGAGIHETGYTQREEEALFFQGYFQDYGDSEINQDAIAYYRLLRILQDIGAYSELIFLSEEGGEDRAQCFKYLQANFLPEGTIERACGLGNQILE